MAEETYLSDDFVGQLMSVGEVDLLVGIATHNHARTIGNLVRTIEECLVQSFPRERIVIVNADGGSGDDTQEILLRAAPPEPKNARGLTSLRTMHRISTRYANSPTPGLALRTILASAELLRTKACAIVSPDNPQPTCGWVTSLLRPAFQEQFDFVAPLYERNKFDGLLARNVLYPMSRAVFGQKIRELHSGEFGFSGRLASHCLSQPVWQENVVRSWPEYWMAITAVSGGFRCCQSFLGPKARSGSPPDLVAAIRQTVGTLFWCLEKQSEFWMGRTGSENVPTFGPDHELDPTARRVNRKRLLDMFRNGISGLDEILGSILHAGTFAEIKRLAALNGGFHYPDELWATTLYEFAASYHHGVLNHDHLIQALVPLYRGKIYSFFLQHQDSSPEEMEAGTENLCLEMERRKPYLLELWNANSEVKP